MTTPDAPPAVLRESTTSAAELMGVADDRGSIEPGKLADLVVESGDGPDLSGLRRRLRAVSHGGRRLIDRRSEETRT